VVEPADEYVENFVRDVPRSFVVPVEHVMRAADGSAQFCGSVTLGTKVRDIVKLVAHSELPVQVVDISGREVGCVDRVHVLSLIAGVDE
jgi:glycine betaine/proline transport system ATP-binding protein